MGRGLAWREGSVGNMGSMGCIRDVFYLCLDYCDKKNTEINKIFFCQYFLKWFTYSIILVFKNRKPNMTKPNWLAFGGALKQLLRHTWHTGTAAPKPCANCAGTIGTPLYGSVPVCQLC